MSRGFIINNRFPMEIKSSGIFRQDYNEAKNSSRFLG